MTVNRDGSVRHATSPSCRDCARQVVIPAILKFSRRRLKLNSFSRYAPSPRPLILTRSRASPSAQSGGWYASLLFETNETQAPRLRNFDTDPPSSYYYEFQSDNRLESVANAHTAADLHVRPDPQTALVSRAVDVANALRDTSCLVSRNENDSTPVPSKTTSVRQIRQRFFAQSSKVLNLCADSKCRATVIFRAIAQNKFIKYLRWCGAEANFRTSLSRYADK